MSKDLWWNFSSVELAVTRAKPAVGTVYGDHDRRRWQLGKLMTPWFGIAGIVFNGQRRLTFRTFFRGYIRTERLQKKGLLKKMVD